MPKKSRKQRVKKSSRVNVQRVPIKDLTYAEALRTVRLIRPSTMILPDLSVEHPPHPDLPVSPITQAKIVAVTHLMIVIGRSPGDYTIDNFDKPINFRELGKDSLEWLEVCGIPARRNYAPLAAKNYVWLFANRERLPVDEDNIERFFSRLIHCLLIEVQILITKQYYHGLGLYKKGSNLSRLDEALPLSEIAKSLPTKIKPGVEFDSFNTVAIDELHGKIFLEYFAVMVRAQWDKLARLLCLVLGVRLNWSQISEGLAVLENQATGNKTLPSYCIQHLETFLKIAHNQVGNEGWIKKFRDPLLHDVGQHPSGVMPHKASIETTSEMWDQVCDEHNWLREAMMAALTVIASAKDPNPVSPEWELHSGIALAKGKEIEND